MKLFYQMEPELNREYDKEQTEIDQLYRDEADQAEKAQVSRQ